MERPAAGAGYVSIKPRLRLGVKRRWRQVDRNRAGACGWALNEELPDNPLAQNIMDHPGRVDAGQSFFETTAAKEQFLVMQS